MLERATEFGLGKTEHDERTTLAERGGGVGYAGMYVATRANARVAIVPHTVSLLQEYADITDLARARNRA